MLRPYNLYILLYDYLRSHLLHSLGIIFL
ncbi:hypothetical protein V2J09_017972 [Rumex salicifolius]